MANAGKGCIKKKEWNSYKPLVGRTKTGQSEVFTLILTDDRYLLVEMQIKTLENLEALLESLVVNFKRFV